MKMDYKYILLKVSDYFNVNADQVLTLRKKNNYLEARHVFYILCVKHGINLYRLAESMNKDRSTMFLSFKRCKHNLKEHVKTVNKLL